jgi:hypothetical protein
MRSEHLQNCAAVHDRGRPARLTRCAGCCEVEERIGIEQDEMCPLDRAPEYIRRDRTERKGFPTFKPKHAA